MKIFLLEHPRSVQKDFYNDIANTPLSSGLITPSLCGNLRKEGHEVMVSEGFMGKKNYAEIEKSIADFVPEIIGVHLIYQWDDHKDLKAFLAMLRKNTAAKIVFYGFYVTFAYEDIFRSFSMVDMILLGEPETAFSAIAKNENTSEIPGVAWRREDGGIAKTQIVILKELDTLAHPMRSPELLSMREMNIEGSRGCYNNCTFCYINNFYGKKCLWRGHSIDYICEEIEMLMKDYDKERFYFIDPNFFGPGKKGKERGRELAKRLKPYHIKFGIEARVNDIEESVMWDLVDAGLEEILIGMESGSQNCLDRLQKHTTVEQNEEALRILRRVGIAPNIGFIMFEPTSVLTDIRTNFEFLKRNRLLEKLQITSNLLYHNQILLQGADCYRELKNLPSPAPYHVELGYENKDVGALAVLMREITNILFCEMAPLWRENIEETKENAYLYQELNDLYVNLFEDNLQVLEKGEEITEEKTQGIINEKGVEIRAKIKKILDTNGK